MIVYPEDICLSAVSLPADHAEANGNPAGRMHLGWIEVFCRVSGKSALTAPTMLSPSGIIYRTVVMSEIEIRLIQKLPLTHPKSVFRL